MIERLEKSSGGYFAGVWGPEIVGVYGIITGGSDVEFGRMATIFFGLYSFRFCNGRLGNCMITMDT